MTLRSALVACLFWVGCGGTESSSTSQALNANPSIADFVLYAERSVHIGSHSSISGNVGVAIATPATFGTQLSLADHVSGSDLYAPTVSIGDHSSVHDVGTGTIQLGTGVAVHATLPFPYATMPALPLARLGTVGTNDVHATAPTQLQPGSYGALDDESVVTLAPGTYSFTSVTVGAHAVLSSTGTVVVLVGGQLVAGDHSSITGSALRFDLAGDDPVAGSICVVGSYNVIGALISAPHGTIKFSDHSSASGAYAAQDIVVGNSVSIANGQQFPVSASGETGTQQLSGYVGIEPDPSMAPLIGPVPSSTLVGLSIGLPAKNWSALQAFAASVSDPHSPQYRHYLTNQQFSDLYGATAADYSAVQQWALSAGLSVWKTYDSRLLVSVFGSAGALEQALHANLVYRQSNDGVSKFVAVDREPSVDLQPQILHISGLDGYMVPRPLAAPCNLSGEPEIGATGPAGGYMAAELRSVYLGNNSICSTLTGLGQTIGVLVLGPFRTSDIQTYINAQTTGISPGTVGGPDTSDQVTWSVIAAVPFTTQGGDFSENSLDIEMAIAMAPQARIHVFEGEAGLGNVDDILFAMANDPDLGTATNSWTNQYSTNAEQALTQMAARGISFFNASGDDGNIGDPGNLLHGLNQTIVGGTILSNSFTGAESTWNQSCPGQDYHDITGGGFLDGHIEAFPFITINPCACYPMPYCCADKVGIPDYQRNVSMAENMGSMTYRNFPDVSAVSATVAKYDTEELNGWGGSFGTSVSAPVWAGFAALANQFAEMNGNGRLGFANPVLYAIGERSDLYGSCFVDIADGVFNQVPASGGFPAVTGYDLATGWGSPRCGLIEQLGTSDPTAPSVYPQILVHVANGHDGVNDESAVFLDIVDNSLPNGGPITITLKQAGEVGWDAIGLAHDIPFTVESQWPGHKVNPFDIGDVTLRFDDAGQTDSWDVGGISVELADLASVTPSACLVDLSGGNSCDSQQSSCSGGSLSDGSPGVVRLGSDAQGGFVDFHMATLANPNPTSWGGCAAWQGPAIGEPVSVLHFELDTGDDDMDGDSELAFDILSGTGDVLESGIIHKPGDDRLGDQTQHSIDVALNDNARCPGCVPVDFGTDAVSGIRLRFSPSETCVIGICTSDEWHVEEVKIQGLNTAASLSQESCFAEGPPGPQFFSITCVAPCITYQYNFDSNFTSTIIPKRQGCSGG